MYPSTPRCPSCPRSRNPTHHGLRRRGLALLPHPAKPPVEFPEPGRNDCGRTKRAASREHEGDEGVGSGAGLAGNVQAPAAVSCAALREFLHLSETSVSLPGSWRK